MRTKSIFTALLFLGMASGTQANEAREPVLPQYMVRAYVYRVLDEAWKETIRSASAGPKLNSQSEGREENQRSGDTQILPSIIQEETSIAGHRVEVREESVTWDGKADPDDPNIVVLAKPSLVTVAGEKANVEIGEGPPECFAPAGPDYPDLYRHVTAKEPIGLRLGCTVSAGETQGAVTVTIESELTVLKERVKLEGVGLDVGPPILSKNHSQGDFRLPLGQWLCLSQPMDDGGGIVLLVNVQELPPPSSAGEDGRRKRQHTANAPVRYSAETVVLEIPAEQSDAALKALVIDPDTTPLTGGPAQIFRDVHSRVRGGKAFSLDDVVDWLQKEWHASVKVLPCVLIDSSQRRGATSLRPASQPNVFSPLDDGDAVPWTLMEITREVPLKRPAGGGSTPSESVEWDVRGLTVGLWAEPTGAPGQNQVDFGFHLRETVDPKMESEANAEMTDRQFRFRIPVERGQWVGFTTTMDKTGKRIIALCAVREQAAPEEPPRNPVEAKDNAPPAEDAVTDMAAPSKYRATLHFLEAAPEDAERIFREFEVVRSPDTDSAKPQFLRIPHAAQEERTFDDLVNALVERGAVFHMSPRFVLDAAPKLSEGDAPRQENLHRELRDLVAMLPQEDASDWAVVDWGHVVDTEDASRRQGRTGVKRDFRGMKSCLYIRPADDARQVSVNAALVGKRDCGPQGALHEPEKTQFVLKAPVWLGEWFGFTSAYEESGRRVVVLATITDQAPVKVETAASDPVALPAETGPQISTKAKFLRIPAQHRDAVTAALVVDEATEASLGNVTVFRDLKDVDVPRIVTYGDGKHERLSYLPEDWLQQFDPEVELISAPRVTFRSMKLAAAMLQRQREAQGNTPRLPIMGAHNGIVRSGALDAEGKARFQERCRAYARVNPMLMRMFEEDDVALQPAALIVDILDDKATASNWLPVADDWLGVVIGVRGDETEPDVVTLDVTLDYRWDAALPEKRLLGIFPTEHEPDVRHVQCGIHLAIPDDEWAGLLFPWKEGENGIMVVLRVDTIRSTFRTIPQGTPGTRVSISRW